MRKEMKSDLKYLASANKFLERYQKQNKETKELFHKRLGKFKKVRKMKVTRT